MQEALSGAGRSSAKLTIPVLAATVLVLGMMAIGGQWVAGATDESSVGRQIRMAEHDIAASVQKLAHEVETVAVWNDAVVYTAHDDPDAKWLDENIGVWLHRMFGHDRVYALNGRNEAVYAMVDGVGAPPEHFERVRSDIAEMVEGVRRHGSILSDRRERKSTGRAVHVSAMRRVDGRPAAVSVMRVVPHADDGPSVAAGRQSLLVAVRFLDGSFLIDLRDEDLMEGARFAPRLDAGPLETALPLRDNTSATIGFLIWRPDRPGAAIVERLIPLFLAMATGVIAIMLLLLRNLRTSLRELRASEAHAQHLAFHDVLTGQPNRTQLMERLDQTLAGALREPGSSFALLLIDLDRFKQVNDALGHKAGDELVRQFAGRLSGLVRRGDLVARLGGDEFAVIQRGVADASDTRALCQRILDCADRPFRLQDGVQANVGVSIGVAMAPYAGHDGTALMRKADIALYRAKAEGRHRACFFADDMDETVKERSRLEAELRKALDGGEGLAVHFQPLMSADGRTMTGLEALVRWNHPELGLLPPSKFLPVAEDSGLSVRLDDWVLDYACGAISRLPATPIAVNLSPAQFYTDDLYERIMATVQRHGVSPQRIELEITEKVLLEDNEACHRVIKRLRNAGFRIALDDFGTGYSSLSYLRRFHVDKIKIDQSFIRPLGRSPASSSIVRAIITMGQAMGLTVTAEGVETEAQLRFLAQAGCDQFQGFLFARPMPEAELSAARVGMAEA